MTRIHHHPALEWNYELQTVSCACAGGATQFALLSSRPIGILSLVLPPVPLVPPVPHVPHVPHVPLSLPSPPITFVPARRVPGQPTLRDDSGLRASAVLPVADVIMQMPAQIGDYTDFYSSINHATNIGTLFRDPKNVRHFPEFFSPF